MENPRDLRYTKEHEWVKVESDIGTVGITDYAQHSPYRHCFCRAACYWKIVEQFKGLAVLESVKSVSDVYSPVSGEVVEANNELSKTPEKINQSPFTEGWIAKIKLKDVTELDNLMTAEQYDEYLKTAKH